MAKKFSIKCLLLIIVMDVVLHLLHNIKIYQEITPEGEFGENSRDDRIYLDMRRSQGYTDELEKLTRDDSGLAVAIDLKAAATKK